MDIHRLPALLDNYVFLLHDPVNHTAAVVDPAEYSVVRQELNRLGANLSAIFNTHHHQDHVGGNQRLLQDFPDLIIYGSAADRDRIPGQKVFLEAGDQVSFGGHQGQVLAVPGHTRGHIAYYFPAASPGAPGELFCGDTLFAGGCGRLFEGTPAQMVESLNQLRQLPDPTRVWCAHEYTLKNLEFALTVDPDNRDLQNRYVATKIARQRQEATIPSQIGVENLTNPFLRWDHQDLLAVTGIFDPIQSFARLRGLKDRF